MAEGQRPGTVVFDIIGTCFSLKAVEAKLDEVGARPPALELWFSQSLRDAFALSLSGGYQPLKVVLQAELPRTLRKLGIEASAGQLEKIVGAFGQLDPHPGFTELVTSLAQEGWKLLALTNSSEDATRNLLQRAGVADRFAALLSCDAIKKTKPHPDVYGMARRASEGETWMIAAHAWDIAGAVRAGLHTVFISRLETSYLEAYPKPDLVVLDLSQVKGALQQTARR
jgi:2-haloacid dehalogenase